MPNLLLLLVLVLLYRGLTVTSENPFTPKGYLNRYWNKQISNNLPKPEFLLDKASPLTAAQYAAFSKGVGSNGKISYDLCSKANLLCFRPDSTLTPSIQGKPNTNVNFRSYVDKDFIHYGTHRHKGLDSFKNYISNNSYLNSFHEYSRNSVDHGDKFASYTEEYPVAIQGFSTYGKGATNGDDKFNNYYSPATVVELNFTSYSDNSKGRKQSFTQYTDQAKGADETFVSYGKNGTGDSNEFVNYAKGTAIMESTFNNYGENGKVGNDTFSSYGTDQSGIPINNFRNYGTKGNSAIETFKTYVKSSVSGHNTFESYGNGSNSGKVDFENYGQNVSAAEDAFTGYGKDSDHTLTVDFKVYGFRSENAFNEYKKTGVKFTEYNESSTVKKKSSSTGRFFREEKLKTGTIMPMPDISDKMPKRSFLPRAIVSKYPFSTSKLEEMKKVFHMGEEDSKMLTDALTECERVPSPGETKKCVASVEDMIDFATSVLGHNVVVRTTENTKGSKGMILLGEVKGINGGNVTKSVSCHQSLYPYLLYYCHSVPNVRVYEADILDPESKAGINHGVAICHLDTKSWSPTHGAFVALGSSPGKIEVCHWIFENDMTWAIAD